MTQVTSATESELLVLDTVDPIHPIKDCALRPAAGGRLISATRIAFWLGASLRAADLVTGSVTTSGQLPAIPSNAAFSSDGSEVAYQVGDDTNTGVSTHLFIAGTDRTLLTRAPIGGHGGPPWGPVNQLEFSAEGNYLLTYSLFGDIGGRPNFLVFTTSGSTAFQSSTAKFGVWTRTGTQLYFLAATEAGGIGGDVHRWDPSAGEVSVSQGLTNYFWPSLVPGSSKLVFNSYDSGGLPRLWSVDLGTGARAQLSNGMSTHPVFVGNTVVWSNEEKPCTNCMGPSAPDGNVLVHDVQTGQDTTIGLLGNRPGNIPTYFIGDVWLS